MDIHKEYPKTVGRKDFWGQIKRTVNGKPVSEEDIKRIVDAVRFSLLSGQTQGDECQLLDLGCGNAALSSYLFDSIDGYTGVDFSPYLIEVAKENFSTSVVNEFVVSDILSFCESSGDLSKFTHILCYGVMSYLPKASIEGFFALLHEKCPNVKRVFFGNLPQRDKAEQFYSKRNVGSYDLDGHESAIGVWWDPKELSELSSRKGWCPRISKMPSEFYASEYRFDLLLSRD